MWTPLALPQPHLTSSTRTRRPSYWESPQLGSWLKLDVLGFRTSVWAGTSGSTRRRCLPGLFSSSGGQCLLRDMAADGKAPRRPSGTGALFVRVDSTGRETWYGKWRVGGIQVKRKLGLKRLPGSSTGLTAREAETALRRAIEETATRPPAVERLDFGEVAERYIIHVEGLLRRKPTTVADYRSMVRRHLGPFFVGRRIERIGVDTVAAYVQTKLSEGLPQRRSRITSISPMLFLGMRLSETGRRQIPLRQQTALGVNPGIRMCGS
jgi:hypothetical protein